MYGLDPNLKNFKHVYDTILRILNSLNNHDLSINTCTISLKKK